MKKYLSLLLLFLIPVIIYFQGLDNDFIIWDDNVQVYENEVTENLSFENLKIIFTNGVCGMYQPMTSLLFAVIAFFFGVKSAFPYHIFSLLLHVVNTFLVFFLGCRLFKNKTKAFLLGLLFSVQHMTVEAVSWVSATSTLLFSFFFLIAMLFYIKYLEDNFRRNYILSLAFFFIGCFCKVQIIPFVGVLFLIDYWYEKPYLSKELLFSKIPFVIIAIIFGWIAVYFRAVTLAVNSDGLPYDKIYFGLNQFAGYIFELITLPHYASIRNIKYVFHFQVFMFCLLICSVYYFRKRRLFVFGVLFFLLNVVLQTTLFSRFNNPYNNRYVYISGIGIWIALLSFSYGKKHVYLMSFYIFLHFLFATAVAINWSNSKSIYRYNKETTSSGYDFGKWKLEDITDQEFRYTYKIKKIDNAVGIYNNIGVAFVRFGLIDLSEWCFLKAADSEPPNVDVFKNLALVFVNINSKKRKIYLLEALSLEPTSFDINIKLGCLFSKTDLDMSEKYFLAAFRLKPNSSIAPMNLGVIYSKNDREKSEEYLLKALCLNPDDLKVNKNLEVFYENSDPKKSNMYLLKSTDLSLISNWKNN
tara:strand:- start:24800 stop:26551 length:1752 start_codon:yes stop_codon:yes gene_type:complete